MEGQGRRSSLLQLLREDRLLLAGTLILSAATLAPLAATPFLPLHDLPSHVGLSSVLFDVVREKGLAAASYQAHLYPLPYWTLTLLLAALSPLIGPLLAAKVAVACALLAVPLGTMRLLAALGRSPRLALLSFALVWDYNTYWGFVAFVMGVGLCQFALAGLVEARSVREAVRGWPLIVLLAFTHAQATGLFLVLGLAASLCGPRIVERLRCFAASAAATGVMFVPWLGVRLAASAGRPMPEHPFDFQGPLEKLERFFEYSLDTIPEQPGQTTKFLSLVVCVVLPALLLLVRQRPAGDRDRIAFVMVAASFAMFMLLPFNMSWPFDQWSIDRRHATPLLLSLLAIPRPDLDRWRAAWLAPGVAVTAAVAVSVTLQFASFGERARPFQQVIDAVPRDKAVLTLTLDDYDPAVTLWPFNQFHAYILAEKGGYDPFVINYPSYAVVFRPGKGRPAPNANAMKEFSFASHGVHYDYLLVQGKDWDPLVPAPVAGGKTVRQVLEAGRWRLYEVVPSP
ncbi:MAG: hypothetical protein QM765_45835 [Myxococcales bacterium]